MNHLATIQSHAIPRNSLLAMMFVLLSTFTVARAQDIEYSSEYMVERVVSQGLIYSFWDYAVCVNLDGCTDRDATEVYIPDSLQWRGRKFILGEIASDVFRDMRHLRVCDFKMGNILVNAFTGCESLRCLRSRRSEPPLIGKHFFYYGRPDEVFEDYHFLTTAVVVPRGCEEAYRNAHGWSLFHTIISHEPTPQDFDIPAIKQAITDLQNERDSLIALTQLLSDSIASLRAGTVIPSPSPITVQPLAAVPSVPAASLPDSSVNSDNERYITLERTSIKVENNGFVYKSRFTPYLILTGYADSTALQLVVPDSVFHGRLYPVKSMWESTFAGFRHLVALTLPSDLANLAPGALWGCPELRLLVMRCASPPAFSSIDKGPCSANDVFDPDHFSRVTLVVPPGSEQAYRDAPGWGSFGHITSAMPSLQSLGVTSAYMHCLALDAHIGRIAARLTHVDASLRALRAALSEFGE